MKSKNLAVFDIDKTLTREPLVIPMIQAEEESGLLTPGTFGEVAKLLTALRSGEIEYEDATHQILVAHAAGLGGTEVAIYGPISLKESNNIFRTWIGPPPDVSKGGVMRMEDSY